MASALDQELSCSICLELFKDPVTLPCMHSFCRECLLSMLIPKQSEDSTDAVCNIKQQDLDGDHSGRVIQCPECRYIAILDEGGVHKLPRNYTLANIVEKYGKPIEEKLTIPCDICDETPPAKACKHCKECQISYCIQCLFLHPKRGVLSKHNLIDPQCQEIQHSNDELEKICLICKCTVTKSDTHKEHSENVVSKETAVNKILSGYSASLNKKRKDVIDYMHSIEVSLQDMRKNYGKKFKDLMERKTSAEKKGMEHLGELQSSLDHISDMMLKVTNQTKTEDFDIMELFKMEESLGKLGNQFTQFSPVDDIGQNVQESNATSVIPDPASSPDKVADDVDTTSLTNKPTPVPASAFPNVATESNETSHSIHCEKIVIKDCVPVLSNSNLGAWLLVTWDTLNTDYLYELKFTCDTVEGGDIHITKGIQGSKHTQTLLRYDTRYIVTVSVMGAEQTESDGFQIKTQQQITCGHFQFSPVLTSEDIELNWKGEILTSEDNKWPERDLHRIQGGAGTLLLHVYQSTQYWEIEVSYHLRGIDDDTNVAIMGICAKDKVDVIDAMEKNYFFYGIALGKSESGAPLMVYYCAGKSKMEDNMQPARLYRKKFGFYFDSNKFRLLVIDCEKNKVVLVTDRLKPKSYLPVCDMASECSDVEFELITGNRISSIPSCIMSCL